MAAAGVNVPCGAIILAAGQSRRMGSNKLLAEINGKPVVAHVADAVLAADLPPPIVVLGDAADDVRRAFDDKTVSFVKADDHAEGMARSLAAGIRAVPPQWAAAIICLGDMPMISPALLGRLAGNADASAILIPTFEERRGNPVLWGRAYFAELASLRGDFGAKALFEQHVDQLKFLPWFDNSIHRDVDTVAELAAMRSDQPFSVQ